MAQVAKLSVMLKLLVVVIGCSLSLDKVEAFAPTLSNSRHAPLLESSLVKEPDTVSEKVAGEYIIGTVVILMPSNGAADTILSKFGGKSPVGFPSVQDAARQLSRKTSHFSVGQVDTELIAIPDGGRDLAVDPKLLETDVLITLGLKSESDLTYAREVFEQRRQRDSSVRARQCQFALDCAQPLVPMLGPYDEQTLALSSILPWTEVASGKRMQQQMMSLFDRWTTDDYATAIMLFLNQFSGSEVDWVKHSIDATWEKGPVRNAKEFAAMVSKCGDCIVSCIQDETCKECLDALNAIDTRDQVSSYRTIVSYESDLLRDFSFCILQKNNIFGCEATIPELPKVPPITTWRGKALTKNDGRAVLIGHLDDESAPEGSLRLDLSWKVACGANVAYDQFPSQNQIFYESVNGRDLWYDPVFRVTTLDGRNVWCKRHYKVRDGPVPGTFYFSVLDNGITSNEFWTIVGVADDLSWIVFHYAGAAGAVGQRYLGGLLCTPDGTLPPESKREEIWSVLDSAGISPWDLFVVNNDPSTPGAISAGPPPLDFFRRDVLAAKQAKKSAQ